ncbi:MAG: MaoC family dehydratase [Candidatus Competibacteraceae bacterium]|nr:MaoC family dehydratase [Candidatus Competibacteraceae bacterium]MCB1822080.1 MaoC family dehydratase [Candidatus Competibacteraceae bacterium]
MALANYRIATVGAFVGQELGVSDWIEIGQVRIDQFAECTGDHQWIHVDRERAAQESPYGGTIAHGFLCLSLVATTHLQLGVAPPDANQVLNYGLDRVRFMAPVKAGARVRNRIELITAEPKGPGRVLIKTRNTIDIEGEDKPALVAELLTMLIAS